MRAELYRRWTIAGKRWFWRVRAGNGEIIAVGGEGYHNRGDAKDMIELLQRMLPVADIAIVEERR